MKILLAVVLGCALVGTAVARDSSARITPAMRAELNAEYKALAQWAANPAVVAAVRAQNAKGPIPGMTNGQWAKLAPNDPVVLSLQKNAGSVWLAKKIAASNGLIREAFLSGAQGELAGFASKPTAYFHTREAKFGEPMKGFAWEGKPEWDKSSRSHSIQYSVPVYDKGKVIGVLTLGVSMKMLKGQAAN